MPITVSEKNVSASLHDHAYSEKIAASSEVDPNIV